VPVLRRSRQLLLPLATLLAAGSIVIASGADFTSTSANAASSYASGTLTHDNSKAGVAIFSGSDLKPGDVVTGEVTITNDGSLPADFALTELAAVNGFTTPSLLNLTITEGATTTHFDDTFGTISTAIDLGEFAAGQARTFTFTATLSAAADNAEQGKTASAEYRWDAVQTN
jgi:spore coat-associated protein N